MSSQDTTVNNKADENESSSSSLSTSPNTVCVLDAPMNGKVYVVGTAHFSVESQKEVAELIRKVKPDRVVLELCEARVNILTLDEETVLKQAKEMDMDKVLKLMKETSVAHGLLQSLLIRLYAQVTEELGLAPGGEFRAAYKEAMKVPGCKVVLGDMPISLTLGRGFYSLPWYRKLRLGWCLLTTNSKITKEDIEELKKSDMLDTLLKEFGSTFPEFKRVLIDERDMYLTNSLRNAYQPIVQEHIPGQPLKPVTVVGVVGLGHVAGIKNNWNKFIDMAEITKNPRDNKSSNSLKYAKWSIVLGTAAVIGYKIWKRRFV